MKLQKRARKLAWVGMIGAGLFGPASYFAAPMPTVQAEVQTISAEGIYLVGDGPDETLGIGQERAQSDAMRKAEEQAGVYVQSYTKTKNATLTSDDISTLASHALKVLSTKYTYDNQGGDGIKIHCHVDVQVDPVQIDAFLQRRIGKNENWEAIKEQNPALQEELRRVDTEMATLKQQYKQARDEQEKQILAHNTD